MKKRKYMMYIVISILVFYKTTGKQFENEEKDRISCIIKENKNEIDAFLDRYPAALRWIEISGYDFTKDGIMEMILSYEYVETSAVISYNNVFDCYGHLLFQFVSNDIRNTEIGVDEAAHKYYIRSEFHIAAHHDVTLYEEISCHNNWNTQVMFAEWDCRDGQKRDENKIEGHAIYESFTPVETEHILEIGYENMLSIFQKKDANGTKEQLQKYSQDYEKQPKEKVVFIEDLDVHFKQTDLDDKGSKNTFLTVGWISREVLRGYESKNFNKEIHYPQVQTQSFQGDLSRIN